MIELSPCPGTAITGPLMQNEPAMIDADSSVRTGPNSGFASHFDLPRRPARRSSSTWPIRKSRGASARLGTQVNGLEG
jgi:hypothetical protein